jgi:hypothetical protein
LLRVTKPGGQVALASWTPEGFLGKMFNVFKAHLPSPPAGVPSPMGWGDEATVRSRLANGFAEVRLTRRVERMRYPFPPAETVEFFRQYYGPTRRSFASLVSSAQAALRRDLVELQTRHNIAGTPGTTEVAAEYLEAIEISGIPFGEIPIDRVTDEMCEYLMQHLPKRAKRPATRRHLSPKMPRSWGAERCWSLTIDPPASRRVLPDTRPRYR